MNKVFLIGRLTDKPPLKQTPTGTPVCTFKVAVTRRHNREVTDFISVVTWRGLAENCAKWLDKGQQVCVEGELQSRSYEDKNKIKRLAWEVNAEDVTFLAKAGQSGEVASKGEIEREMNLVEDQELPF